MTIGGYSFICKISYKTFNSKINLNHQYPKKTSYLRKYSSLR